MSAHFFSTYQPLWDRYERHISIAALAAGFTFDLFLAKRPDSVADNVLLVGYLLLAAWLIVYLTRKSLHKKEGAPDPALPMLALQFSFGGLASNLLILYGKSGTVGGSVLFVGLLAAFALGNEFLKSRYAQLRFNIAIYYLLLLSYLVIAVPTFVLHTVGLWVFCVTGIISLGLLGLLLLILFRVVYRGTRGKVLVQAGGIVLGMYALFSLSYFLGFIPPVPLSMKTVGVYHAVARQGDSYTASFEKPSWYVFWRDTSATYALLPGQGAYCFSSVFAPTGLATPIHHTWEYQNGSGKWDTVARVEFPINGGREEGYRGYTYKSVMAPGNWRCSIETSEGQLIGRISFTVVSGVVPEALSTATL